MLECIFPTMTDASLPHPDNFHAQAALGWMDLGDLAEARRELERITQAQQQHPDTLEVGWKLCGEEGDWKAALTVAEQLVAVAPGRLSGWIDQSYSLHELRRTAEAYERLAAAAEKFPEEFVIPYNLACYQCRLGRPDEALRWLECAVTAADRETIRAMAADDPDLEAMREQVNTLLDG